MAVTAVAWARLADKKNPMVFTTSQIMGKTLEDRSCNLV
jgi:hypothetical protein